MKTSFYIWMAIVIAGTYYIMVNWEMAQLPRLAESLP